MKGKVMIEPIDLIKELKFKFIKESHYQINRYTKQLRRTARQILSKYKSEFKSAQ